MPRTVTFRFPLAQGLHARPASLLREAARQAGARATFLNDRNGRSADCASVIALMGTETASGDPCRILLEGTSAPAAASSLEAFVAGPLARCDDIPAGMGPPGASAEVPRAVAGAGRIVPVAVASEGVAIAPIVRVSGWTVSDAAEDGRSHATARDPRLARPDEAGDRAARSGGAGEPRLRPDAADDRTGRHGASEEPLGLFDAATELARAREALGALKAQLAQEHRRTPAGVARDLLRAHLDILDDPSVEQGIEAAATFGGASASQAIVAAAESVARGLESSASRCIRERAADVRELAARLLAAIDGRPAALAPLALSRPSIVVAERLGPAQLLGADRGMVAGLVVVDLSATAHVAILARSFGIPAAGCDREALTLLADGERAILDSKRRLLILDPDAEALAYYERDLAARTVKRRRIESAAARRGATRDGAPLAVLANVSSADEGIEALAQGADGIGLFRTEMLFLDRPSAPSEEEQRESYARLLDAASDGRPVVFRTLDVGGDKPLPYADWPAEDNPALGLRGVRVYRRHADLARTQLRALARAALGSTAPVKVMFPMVTSPADMRRASALVAEARSEVGALGGPLEAGAMIEVPAAALSVGALARDAAFFSVGTNDLLQYLAASDRGGEEAADRLDPRQPPLWRLLQLFVDEAHEAGRPVGVCGELAGDVSLLPLLVGLGVGSISLSAPGIAAVKRRLARLDRASCRDLLDRAAHAFDAAEVQSLLDEQARTIDDTEPLTAPSLVRLDSAAPTRALAIKELVDLLDADDRLTDEAAVEAAVWAREDAAPTAVGFGFAIPHCRSAAVRHPSIAMVRLAAPVAWSDDEEVRVALLLAVPEASADRHLRHLAALARRLAHREFREALCASAAASDAASLLAAALGA